MIIMTWIIDKGALALLRVRTTTLDEQNGVKMEKEGLSYTMNCV